MTHFRTAMAALAVLPLLAACEGRQSQNQYDYSEVGKSNVAEFGTVAGVREVDVKGQNSGAGALAGGVGGGIAGNAFGNGYGQVTTAVAGALIGAAAGHVAEQAAADYKATEYTIVKENGKTLTVVQNNKPDEPVFRPGDRVLVQTSGSFQRVLPAAQLPTSMKKPQGIEFTN